MEQFRWWRKLVVRLLGAPLCNRCSTKLAWGHPAGCESNGNICGGDQERERRYIKTGSVEA